jgi:hypothetical protein
MLQGRRSRCKNYAIGRGSDRPSAGVPPPLSMFSSTDLAGALLRMPEIGGAEQVLLDKR